ncbi:hypothetical protein [Pseudomonas sp. EA_35y_Pfl2_R5]|uniref:hypothetical protein n=1 Tax=Pseudomonas sp. EA_35y_Pfl2_R5 TaxID=3088690 RepID=UPI0030DD617E
MLSREEVVAVAVRLFAVFLTVQAIRLSVQAISADPGVPSGDLALGIMLTVIFPLAAAVLLWLFPLSIASTLLPINKGKAPQSNNYQSILETGCILIGLWLLASALTDMFYWVVILIVAARSDIGFAVILTEDIANMIATGVQVFIALYLLLGYRSILNALNSLRSKGVSR